jgi:hypothetical protein
VLAEPPGGRTDAAVAAVVRRAAHALASAGYEVVEACPPRFEEAVRAWGRLLIGDFALVLGQLPPRHPSRTRTIELGPEVRFGMMAACWSPDADCGFSATRAERSGSARTGQRPSAAM